ncbi:MAG TPA: hypothetical protein VGP72_33040 [Planctomycetota bacterium]|jgi:hypothetical protein
MRRIAVAVAVVLFCGAGAVPAATKAQTVPDMVKDWLALAGKDFKRVKTTDTFVTFSPFASRTLNTMEAAGIDSGGHVFSSLSVDLQNALTKLVTDLNTLKDKQSNFSKLVTNVEDDLRDAARTGTPPTIEVSTVLAYGVYNAAFDGIIDDKEKAAITAANTAVVATAGLDPKIVSALNSDVSSLVAGSGVNKLDLTTIKNDLAGIAAVLKLMK